MHPTALMLQMQMTAIKSRRGGGRLPLHIAGTVKYEYLMAGVIFSTLVIVSSFHHNLNRRRRYGGLL